MIFCLFHCFHQRINKKYLILPQYTFFSEKKKINDVFFNVFKSINGILNKTLFNKYNICNLNKEENSAFLKRDFFKLFLIFSFVGGRIKKYILYLDTIFFLYKCTNYLFLCFYPYFTTIYLFFSKTA